VNAKLLATRKEYEAAERLARGPSTSSPRRMTSSNRGQVLMAGMETFLETPWTRPGLAVQTKPRGNATIRVASRSFLGWVVSGK
jgi:hypothetical protein